MEVFYKNKSNENYENINHKTKQNPKYSNELYNITMKNILWNDFDTLILN